MNENEWEKLLKIHTTGADNTDADQYRYPYEPTPYSVLERLGNSGWIRKENTLLDEIDCRDLFSGDNPRERIVIFEF